MLYAIVGLLFLLADQFLKFWTVAHVELNAYPGIELIPGVLNLTYIKNTGIAFGLFGDVPALRWVLLGLLVLFTAFIVGSLLTRYLRTGFARWTGVLLLTGLLGNGVDRAVYGYVVDMLEPKLGSISWPIFNIADALILIFGILFCIAVLTGGFGKPKRKKRRAPAARRAHPEPARGEKRRQPRREPAERRPRNPEARPARRPAPAPAEEPAPAQKSAPSEKPAAPVRPARVTEAEAAQMLRRTGSALAAEEPAPEAIPEDVPLVTPEEEIPVQIVERPAPAPAPEAEPEVPASAIPKPSIEDMDLDSILAEFK